MSGTLPPPAGLLRPLVAAIACAHDDPLSAMSCLAELQNLVAPAPSTPGRGGAASSSDGGNGGRAGTLPAVLHDELMPLLAPLLQDPLLGPSALAVSAALMRATRDLAASSSGRAGGGSAATGPSSSPADAQQLAGHPLMAAVRAALDERLDAPPDQEAAAMDALGILGLSREGAEVALTAPGVGQLVAKAVMTRALTR